MKRLFAVGSAIAAIVAIVAAFQPVIAQENPATSEFYTQHVKPILQTNCYRCHAGMNRRGGLNMETREALLKGGKDGPALVPGDPANSLLIKLIRHEGPANDPMDMPPRGKLSDVDIAVVEQWVKAGAIMPHDPAK